MSPMEIQPVRLVRATDKTAAAASTRPAAKVTEGDRDVEVSRSELHKSAGAPIDAERVETIRAAIADGSYRVMPEKIADAMIAAAQASRTA